MPAPSALQVRLVPTRLSVRRTLDGSACASSAGVHRVVTCQWQYLQREETALLLSAALSGPALSVTYPDPQTGQTRQMTACCTDHSVGLWRMREGVPVWTQVHLELTET